MRIVYQYLFKISNEVVNFMKYSYDMNLFNLNVTCNKCGYLNVRAGEEWRTDSYTFTQNKFYYITEGQCTLIIDGKEIAGKENDWFFIPDGKEYHYTINNTKEAFQKHWMHFDIYPNNDLFTRLNLPYVIKSVSNTTVKNLFEKYQSIRKSQAIADKLLAKSIVTQLLSEYIRLSSSNEISITEITDSKLNEILRYMGNNIDKPLMIKELADMFQMQPPHFIKYFKKQTGYTPAKYILERKLHFARVCLEKTDMYIYEIMEKIGETNPATFSKQFKAKYSYSPNEYRKRNNKKV